MNYQPKVNNTQKFEDNLNQQHNVVPGKIVHVEQSKNKDKLFPCISCNRYDNDWKVLGELVRSPRKYFKTYIISENEEIQEGDHYLNYNDKHENGIRHYINGNPDIGGLYEGDNYKILVLPETLLKIQLNNFIDSELVNDVLVKCEMHTDQHPDWRPTYNNPDDPPTISWYTVHLNHANHAIIFNSKSTNEQMLEKFAQEYVEKEMAKNRFDVDDQSFKDGFTKGIEYCLDNGLK